MNTEARQIAENSFWAKVEKRGENECWPWLASNVRGYGRFWAMGKQQIAHRFSWEILNGMPFPEGKIGCHSCDNPSCCNPKHIWPGTHLDNAQDAKRKGRLAHQKQTHCSKGHLYAPENTYMTPGRMKFRTCRICKKEADHARTLAKTEKRRKVLEVKLPEIRRLFEQGLRPSEITKLTGVRYPLVALGG